MGRWHRGVTPSIAAAVALLCASANGWAQTYQGAVRGQVRDQQGVMPGTAITLINEESNAARVVVTNPFGEYAFPGVLPGTYTIRASQTGFRTEERRGLRIVTQSSIVQDFVLEVGAIAQEITVTIDAPVVERATATVSTALSAAEIASLPIFGRNTFLAAIGTPGVIHTGSPQFVRYQDQTNSSLLSIGGGPRRGNAYLLEGVSITDFINRPAWVPSTEAIENVRVHVKTFDADTGRAGGGVFNVTARSGGNRWRGSALALTKPGWATGQLFFAKRAGIPNPRQHYYNWAGSVGGPLVRDRTFVWFSKDDYTQRSTFNSVLTFPTALERAGDFSRSVNAQGQLSVIFDPLTTRPDPDRPGEYIRDPFPGNVIPSDRINPVARAMLSNMPVPTVGRSFNGQAAVDDGPQRQETLKVDHRWNRWWAITGMYGHQRTREPSAAFWGPQGSVPGDPGNGVLDRTVHFAAVNNVLTPSNATVVTVRYGHNRFEDAARNSLTFDAGSLGFPPAYVNALTFNTFPLIEVSGYGRFGSVGPDITTHVGRTANLTAATLAGRHSLKLGADYRRIEARTMSHQSAAGFFAFTEGFTQGPTPNRAGPASGDAIASFLLGYPAGGTVHVATPATYFIDYYAAYVQDDVRLTPGLTLNLGVRYEHEPGVAETNNRITVGFDRDAAFPVQVPGLDLKGGLMYAGVNGNPTRQAQPLTGVAPRAGVAWALGERAVIRGGYGWYWTPVQIPALAEHTMGARGYSAATTFLASADGDLTPAGSLSNPFPRGITQPHGNALGLATGAGGVIDFVDQSSRPGYVQQISVDWQRELGGDMLLSVGYMHSRSRRLSMGGTADATVNINQLAPEYLALGSALQQQVANPFFGNPAFGNLSTSLTLPRAQLLRPFPQFGNVLAHRVNEARARHNALVARWNKQITAGYAFEVNYTLSRLEDNQFGESNAFSSRLGSALNNYDLGAEYGVSLLDVAHRLNFSVTFESPFGDGRRWLNDGGAIAALAGGWSLTLAGRYQSGFPLSIWQSSNNSGLLGSMQRPNLVPGVNPMTEGRQEDRAVRGWINPAAFTAAEAFTFGNGPRTNPDWRGPGQRTTDLAIQKTERLGNTTVSVRADVLNIFDDPLFNGPVTAFGTTDFGRITGVGGFARSMQFQVRVGF